MWHVIKNELRAQHRNANPSKKTLKTDTTTKRKEHESEPSDEELETTAGVAMVDWYNMPLALRIRKLPKDVSIESFCGYDFQSFRNKVKESFALDAHSHAILKLREINDRSFQDARKEAASHGYVAFELTTEQIEIEEQLRPVPEPVLVTPAKHQAENEAANRQIAWNGMITEAREKGANRLDLSVRLWLFNLLRNLSQTDAAINMKDVVLKYNVEEDEDLAARVSCSHP